MGLGRISTANDVFPITFLPPHTQLIVNRQNTTAAVQYASLHRNTNLGTAYYNGEGVERDETMARHYYELAAMEGDSYARHNLGVDEYDAGNYDRALKHYMVAVRAGKCIWVGMWQKIITQTHYDHIRRT